MKFMSLVMRDGAAAAIRQYREDMKENAVANALPEDGINRLGYGLLGAKKVDDAIRIFQWNVELYPKSWNVYDSLGEAFMIHGDKELAIKNYRRSLELNPENSGGAEMLKKLDKDK
jgi:tetratricopeptide (TPR) repeat protein